MNREALPPEVFRGMDVQPSPLRLRRAAAAAAPTAAPRDLEKEREATLAVAVRAGYEQGRRAGHEEGLASGREEGLRTGHAEGRAQGCAAAEEAHRATLALAAETAALALRDEQARVQHVAEALAACFADTVEAAEAELVAQCFEVICRVLGAHAVQADSVRAQVLHVLSTFRREGALELHLHPDDVALLSEAELPPRAKLRWIADPAIAFGGCRVEAAGAGLDARLETSLDACKSALLLARRQRVAECRAQEAAP